MGKELRAGKEDVGYVGGEGSVAVTTSIAPAMTEPVEVYVVVAIVTGEQHLSWRRLPSPTTEYGEFGAASPWS